MKSNIATFVVLLSLGLSGCGKEPSQPAAAADPAPSGAETAAVEAAPANSDVIEVAPGLMAEILKKGFGRAAEAGDYVEVHYTGWLYDAEAENNRGGKFDSSVDRGQKFQFQLGAGQVIQGWDKGIDGMLIGEIRQLTIAPEMGYGDRGAGNVIPPGATLVFEVELFGLESPGSEQ
jgi:FKBP-type peptidyl-prolyl cis-trans isomerase